MNILITSLCVFVAVNVVVMWFSRGSHSPDAFFVANRQSGVLSTALSVGATFLYAFGVLMASAFSYSLGWSGLAWLIIPNLFALVSVAVMGYFLLQRQGWRQGFNFTDLVSSRYQNPWLTHFYALLYTVSAVYAITANLTGFGMVVDYLAPGWSYHTVMIIMALMVLIYTMWGGLRSSIHTDSVQMLMLLAVAIVGAGWLIYQSGGWHTVWSLWTTAKPTHLWDARSLWQPGLLLMALLPASAMADNSLYQRMLSMRDQSRVIPAFVLGGIIMVITMAGMGMMAATVFVTGAEPPRPHLAHVMQLTAWAHPIMMIMFVCALLSACASTIDSALNSVGSVWANTVWRSTATVTTSRITIATVMMISVLLSWLRIDLWILITTFGVLRLMIVVPTIYTAVARTVRYSDAWSIFAGIIASAAFVTAVRTGVITVTPVSEAWITVMIPVIPIVCVKLIGRAMRRTNRA